MTANMYNVVTVADYMESTAQAARFGAAFWRCNALSALGETGPWSKQDLQRASGLDSDTLRSILPALFRELTEYSVSREGIAHRDAVASVQTHLRNAFTNVKGATARFKDKPDLAATSAYQGEDALYRVATRFTGTDTGYSAMIGVKLASKQDILDDTKETAKGVGDSADSIDLTREASLSHADQEKIENQREIGEQFADHHVPLGTGRSEPSEREPEPEENARLVAWQQEHGKRTRALRASLDKAEKRNSELLTLLRVNNRLLKQAKKNLA